MGCLLTKYNKLKHDKFHVYMKNLRILNTYQWRLFIIDWNLFISTIK